MTKQSLAAWRASTPAFPNRKQTEDLDPVYAHIGAVIREMRFRHGFTQEEVAQKIDLARSSVANIEAGNQPVTIPQLVEIANILEIPAIDLLPEGYLE